MLIHLSPRLLAHGHAGQAIELVDVTIPELGILLKGGVDLVTRTPYRNKNYLVACRKSGQKAINGILIETPGHVEKFTMVARWAVDASAQLYTHRVAYTVLDRDYDTVSESMGLWHSTSEGLGSWKSRWPKHLDYNAPVHEQPRMDLLAVDRGRRECKEARITDTIAQNGRIVERVERFQLPTIERGRLSSGLEDRLPALDTAFAAQPIPVQHLVEVKEASAPAAIVEWPTILPNARSIAAHIEATASDYVDTEYAEEHFHGTGAVLRRLPVSILSEGHVDGNIPCEAKAQEYSQLPLETMPPIVCQNGVVEDGNHRLRDARARGATHIWAYVVMDEADLPDPAEVQAVQQNVASL